MKKWLVFKSNRTQEEPESERIFAKLSNKNKTAIEKHLGECSIKSKGISRTANRKRTLVKFLYFIEKDFDKINYDDYVSVAKAISESSISVYTKNDERDFIKRFLRENYDDYATRFKEFKLLSNEQKSEDTKLTSRDLLTDIEIEKIIKATDSMKYKALISCLAESGCRPEELLKLRWSDIDFSEKMIYLFSSKTKKKRAIPLEVSISHLSRLRKESEVSDSDYIFYSKVKNKKLSRSALNFIIQESVKKAGINKKVFPYLFRHSKLSLLITKLTPKVYEEVAGHSLEMGLKIYSHLSQDKIISEMREKVYEIKELSENDKEKLEHEIYRLRLDAYAVSTAFNEVLRVMSNPKMDKAEKIRRLERSLRISEKATAMMKEDK